MAINSRVEYKCDAVGCEEVTYLEATQAVRDKEMKIPDSWHNMYIDGEWHTETFLLCKKHNDELELGIRQLKRKMVQA